MPGPPKLNGARFSDRLFAYRSPVVQPFVACATDVARTLRGMAESLDRMPDLREDRANRALVGVMHGGFGYLDWYDQAACRNRDSRLWFSSYRRTIDGAIAVCRRCPFRPACLALAMDHPELVGVWGGTDEVERARARREERRKAR